MSRLFLEEAMEEFLREQTECAVCLDVIEEPKTLTCLHTFCYECLRHVTKRGRVTCPICQTETDSEDIRYDFRVRELLEIRRLRSSETSALTARQQVTDHMKNLLFLKDEFQDRVAEISDNNAKVKGQLVKRLRSNKRKFIAAFEKQCAATELKITEIVMDGDVIKRVRQTIADIDVQFNDAKYTLKTVGGHATVGATKRFCQQLADLAERGPPETHVAKHVAPLPQFVTFTAAELDEFVQRCFAERNVPSDDVASVNNDDDSRDAVDTGLMATTGDSSTLSWQPSVVVKPHDCARNKCADMAAFLKDSPLSQTFPHLTALFVTAATDSSTARHARSCCPDERADAAASQTCSSTQSEPPAKAAKR